MWSNKDKKKKSDKDLKSFWGLDDNESKEVKEENYDTWNFDEEELEDDDYYNEDDE